MSANPSKIDDMGYFVDKIRAKREAEKVSQNEMAELLGMSRENYNSFENGRRPLNEDRLKLVAKKLSIPFEQIKAWERLDGATEKQLSYLRQELLGHLGPDLCDKLEDAVIKHGTDVVYRKALEYREKKRKNE